MDIPAIISIAFTVLYIVIAGVIMFYSKYKEDKAKEQDEQ